MHKKKLTRRKKQQRNPIPRGVQAAATVGVQELQSRFTRLNELMVQLKEYTPAIREKVTLVRDALRSRAANHDPLTTEHTEYSALADHLDYALNKLVTF